MVDRYRPGIETRIVETVAYTTGAVLLASAIPICSLGKAGLALILITFIGIISDIKWWLYRRFGA
jgi:hypothetical protein